MRDIPAFPNSGLDAEPAPGMTLHQYFAGQALVGICANAETGDNPDKMIAAMAINAADAMIKEYECRDNVEKQRAT